MSDTPRTDAEKYRNCYGWDLCRKLELELAILIEAIRDECDIPEGIRQALIQVTGGIKSSEQPDVPT